MSETAHGEYFATMRDDQIASSTDPVLQERLASEWDRMMAAHDAEVRAETESDPAEDERLVRYMAMVTPLGYQSALSVVQQMTLMIQAETEARRAGVVTEEPERRPWAPEDGDLRCQECGRLNPVWWANNEDWNTLMPNDGILCPSCYHRRWLAARVPVKQEGDDDA